MKNDDFVFTLEDVSEQYVFEAGDNLSRPVESQMTAEILPLSAQDEDRIMRAAAIAATRASVIDPKGKSTEEISDGLMHDKEFGLTFTNIQREERFFRQIGTISNVSYKTKGEVKQVTDIRDLYQIRAAWARDLVSELRKYISKTREIPEKNS